jgi:hypothetical protein
MTKRINQIGSAVLIFLGVMGCRPFDAFEQSRGLFRMILFIKAIDLQFFALPAVYSKVTRSRDARFFLQKWLSFL